MSINYDYNPESYQYNIQGVDSMQDYADGYRSRYVTRERPTFFGFGRPFFGESFWDRPHLEGSDIHFPSIDHFGDREVGGRSCLFNYPWCSIIQSSKACIIPAGLKKWLKKPHYLIRQWGLLKEVSDENRIDIYNNGPIFKQFLPNSAYHLILLPTFYKRVSKHSKPSSCRIW